jgi:hypothetical protein
MARERECGAMHARCRSRDGSFQRAGWSSLYHVTGGVQLSIGQPEGCDDPVASAFGRPEVNEEHLVLFVVNDFGEGLFDLDFFAGRQVAFEDGVLQVIAKVLARFEGQAQALAVGDVVADEIRGAHGLSGEQRCVLRDLAGKSFAKQSGLQFEGSPVADFVIKDRMGNDRTHALFVDLEEAFASGR